MAPKDPDADAEKGAERKAFLLRLPPALFDCVKALADRDLRSVNAEIEFLLVEAVRRRTGREPQEPQGRRGGGGAS